MTSHFIGKKNIPMVKLTINKSLQYIIFTGIIFGCGTFLLKNVIPYLFFKNEKESVEIYTKCLYVAFFHIPFYITYTLIVSFYW